MSELEALKKALEQEQHARKQAEEELAALVAERKLSREWLSLAGVAESQQPLHTSRVENPLLTSFPEEMPDPILRVNENGVIVYSNKAYQTHWAPELKLQKHDPIPTFFQQDILRAKQRRQPHTTEFTIGGRRWSVQFHAVDQQQYVNLLARDITEHKKAEEKLRHSQEALLEAQELGNLGRWELNLKELSLQWSPQLYRQYGLSPEDPTPSGGDFFVYVHPDDLTTAREGIRTAIANGFAQFEQRILRPDGTIRHLYTTVKAQYEATGEAMRIYGTSLDVTELRHTEAQLLESEERFNLAMQGMNDGIWDWNLKTGEVYLSPQWKALIGYEDHELENNYDTLCCVAHPDDVEMMKSIHDEHVKLGTQNLSYETRMQHRNGSWVYVKARCRLVYNQAGDLIRMVGACSDITQQKKSDQKIAKTIEQLKILSRISFSFSSISEDFEKPIQEAIRLIGTHTDVSRVYVFENSSDGVFASNTFEWCNRGIAPQIEEQQNVAYSSLPNFKRLLKKDGLALSGEEISPALRNGLLKHSAQSIMIMPLYLQDSLAGFVGFDDCTKARTWEPTDKDLLQTFSNLLGNIFERQQAEYKMLQSEEKYRSLVDNLTEVIFQTDEQHNLTFLNPAWREITGYSTIESIGKPLTSYILPEDRSEFLSLQQLLHEHKIDFCRQILRIRIKDDEIRSVEIFARLIEDKWGQTTGLSGTLNDVTEQQQAKENLIKAKEGAEKASQAKAQFLSVMSHEIRTPLNAMLGISQLLIRQKPRPDQEDNLRLLIFSGENLLSLINDILDFNKIESGKIVLEKSSFDLRKLCNGLHKSLSLKADEKNVHFQLSIDPSIPQQLMGDPTRLTQILNNLLDNAIKFTHRGSVALRVELHQLAVDKVQLHFEVKDTGIGIPAESLEHIFESFTQAHQSSSKQYGGTGLGLAIIKRLLELQGSQIVVESTDGLGSIFSFSLWLDLAEEADVLAPPANTLLPEKSQLKSASLLVVEDNPLNMLVLVQFLESWGVHPDVADNGLQALEKLQTKPYDLVLLDLHMPELNGMETIYRIRKELLMEDLPVIALTANALPGIRQKVLAAGMTDYISKPFEPDDLYKKVLKYLPKVSTPSLAAVELLPSPQLANAAPGRRFHLQKLYRQSNNNPAFVARMVKLFISSCGEHRSKLQTALLQGDAACLRDIAHKLKPSLDLFEVRCQHHSIRKLEVMELSELQTPEGWTIAEELISCLKEVCLQLHEWLEEQKPETTEL